MLAYYFKLALRSFRRNKVLTALMVLAIALGIGAAMTTLTVFKVLSGDPIPHKSERLFYVQIDPQPLRGYQAGEEPEHQLTRFDAEEMLRQKKALHTESPVIDVPGVHYECRIVYKSAMDSAFLDPALEKLYPNKDYHTLYFGEILTCYTTE